VTAARWVQQDLLQHHSDSALRVYAIWFNMYPGDARTKWPEAILVDPRVVHYWDAERALGQRYLSHLAAMMDRRAPSTLPPSADAMWDAFYVYPPGDRWQEPVPVPVSWGYPIMVTRDQLLGDVARLSK
jgi:hypothetical protein